MVLVLAAASLATVPILVGDRAGRTNAIQIEAYLDTLSRSGVAFQTGRVAAFLYVNLTLLLAALALVAIVVRAAAAVTRADESRSEDGPRQAIGARWRAALTAYLVLAPVVVLVLVGWLCGD